MKADKWIFPLVLCFMCVSSIDEPQYEKSCEKYQEFCETHKISAPLGSSVLLPCEFANNKLSLVSWIQTPGVELVQLKSKGRIQFLHPRSGRLKAFPYQGSNGNFSIYIDELEDSDLGCYHCLQEEDCIQVELAAATETLRKESLLIYIGVGMAIFILLCICSYLLYINSPQNHTNNCVGGDIEVTSAAPAVTDAVPVHEQQRGLDNNLVYENDDQGPINQPGDSTQNHHNIPGGPHDVDRTQPIQSTSGIYPHMNQFNFERVESKRTQRRFHRELINRLRQASFSRHYYVNQGEISRQQATAAQPENHQCGFQKKQAKEKHDCYNPIYNRSTDQLNRL